MTDSCFKFLKAAKVGISDSDARKLLGEHYDDTLSYSRINHFTYLDVNQPVHVYRLDNPGVVALQNAECEEKERINSRRPIRRANWIAIIALGVAIASFVYQVCKH